MKPGRPLPGLLLGGLLGLALPSVALAQGQPVTTPAPAGASSGASSTGAPKPPTTLPSLTPSRAPRETTLPQVTERSRLEVAPAGRAFVSLTIENSLGDVRIEGHDGRALVIETIKRAPDDASIDRLRVSLVPGLDGSVRIGTAADGGREARPVAKNATRVDLVIRAPRDLKFAARVGSGQLEVTGMDSGGEVDAATGSITMRNIGGEVTARSISGPVTLSEMFGSIDTETIDAAIKLDSINGASLVTSAHKGTIDARRVRSKRIEMMTTTGDVDLEGDLALGGKVMVSSLRGNLTVRLRSRGAVTVRATGSKVDLGEAAKTRVVKGVTLAELGEREDGEAISAIDLRSRYGVVTFSVDW